MAQGRVPAGVDEFGHPIPIDDGTLNRQRSPIPGPNSTAASDWRVNLRQYVERIERATDWETLDHYAGIVLGSQSFALGVAAGFVEGVVGSVTDLLGLIKTFILADIYDQAQHSPGWRFWEYGNYLAAQGADYFFHQTLEESHSQRDRILLEVEYAVHHPGDFFGALGQAYLDKYNRFRANFSRGTASGMFAAGKIAGEILLDVLAVIGVGEAAVRFAAKMPELARIARGLRVPLRIRRPITTGAAGAEAEAGALGQGPGTAGANAARVASRFATRPNEAVFWSGRTGGIGGAERAGELARGNGGTTLEQLMERRNINLPEWDATNPASLDEWQTASREFAQNASGNVRAVLGETLRPGNVWETVEYPALVGNPNVSQIMRIDPKTGLETLLFRR